MLRTVLALVVATLGASGLHAADVRLEAPHRVIYAGDPVVVRVVSADSAPDGTIEVLDADDAAVPQRATAGEIARSEVDLAAVFPALRHPGAFRARWSGERSSSEWLELRVIERYDPSVRHEALIRTEFGEIVAEFLPDESPIAVKAFVDTARAGSYDGIDVVEVSPDGIVVLGAPATDGRPLRFPVDRVPLRPRPGALAMVPASASPPSNSAQFMILLEPRPEWAGQVTIFGWVRDGAQVARMLSRMPTGSTTGRLGGVPTRAIQVRSVEIRPTKGARPGSTAAVVSPHRFDYSLALGRQAR